MVKNFFLIITIFLVSIGSFSLPDASAYTYGDPNEEAVAEVYKKMLVELNEEPPDYKNAINYYETVREEIDMHMGSDASNIILENLENENKEEAIANMERLLVLNIARRLENIEKNFEEYDTSKKLLAKGFATYNALSPKVESEHAELDQQLKAEFDKALSSLGNPGLFGVGKKESSLDQFVESKESILSVLQEEFELKSLKVGHFSESVTESSEVKNSDWTDITKVANWVPLLIIVGILIVVIMYARRRRK